MMAYFSEAIYFPYVPYFSLPKNPHISSSGQVTLISQEIHWPFHSGSYWAAILCYKRSTWQLKDNFCCSASCLGSCWGTYIAQARKIKAVRSSARPSPACCLPVDNVKVIKLNQLFLSSFLSYPFGYVLLSTRQPLLSCSLLLLKFSSWRPKDHSLPPTDCLGRTAPTAEMGGARQSPLVRGLGESYLVWLPAEDPGQLWALR